MKNIELVSPAGDLEKLEYAFIYGADAVYLSDKNYGMRTRAGNFTEDEIAQGVRFAHSRNKKVYAAVNIFLRNTHLKGVSSYLSFLDETGVDAVIIADSGILKIIGDNKYSFKIHLSTLANVTNIEAAKFWEKLGIQRIILARELSLKEVSEIRKKVKCEIEVFVHGAMCISYSGRCLLSSYLTGRNANLGDCAQSCRWGYALAEEKRPGVYIPIEEDGTGSFIMSSKDLCMLEHLKELIDTGVDALKIEGRIKSLYYVGNVTRAYRKAINDIAGSKVSEQGLKWCKKELNSVPNRGFSTGFFYGRPDSSGQLYDKNSSDGGYQFIGTVKEIKGHKAVVNLKNPVKTGDKLEFISPDLNEDHGEEIVEIYDKNGFPVQTAAHDQEVTISISGTAAQYELMRKPNIMSSPHPRRFLSGI